MSKNNSETTVYVPESTEPDFPVNITSWKHYTTLRLLTMALLAWTLLGLAETAYVTTVRISEIRCEARTRVCSRGKLGRGVDNVKRYWWGRPTEHQLVERKTSQIVRRKRLWSAFKVLFAWALVVIAFSKDVKDG
jgi:hypothetical protein